MSKQLKTSFKVVAITTFISMGGLLSPVYAASSDITYELTIPLEIKNDSSFSIGDSANQGYKDTGFIRCIAGTKADMSKKLISTGSGNTSSTDTTAYFGRKATSTTAKFKVPYADRKKYTHYKCAVSAGAPTSEAEGLNMTKSVLSVSGALPVPK